MKVLNRLPGHQTYQLVKFYETNHEVLRKLPATKIAAKATVDLGFGVTPANIEYAVKVTGLKLERQRRPRLGGGGGSRTRYLSRTMIWMLQTLGESVPRGLWVLAEVQPGTKLDYSDENRVRHWNTNGDGSQQESLNV